MAEILFMALVFREVEATEIFYRYLPLMRTHMCSKAGEFWHELYLI